VEAGLGTLRLRLLSAVPPHSKASGQASRCSESGTLDSLNPSTIVFDELHQHEPREVPESARGANR
jgi:hypothetical protein